MHVNMATPLSIFKKMYFNKREEEDEARPTNIYLESGSPKELHKWIYMVTLVSLFNKKPKMVPLAEERMEVQA